MDMKNPFCQPGQLCDHTRVKFTLPKSDSGLRKIQTFKIDKYARRMCVFAGAIWLPCCMDDCILVYSFDGMLLQTVKTFGIEKPYALWEYNEKYLMVAAENGLFLLEDPPRGVGQTMVIDTDNHGQRLTKLRSGSFCDVYIQFPHAVFLEYKEGKVYLTTYRQAFGRITESTTNFKLNHETDYLDSIFLKHEHVYVSSCTRHSIMKYNKKGVLLAEYGQFGEIEPGQLMYPTICSTLNKKGAIVVADSMNNRLQAVDEIGQWKVLFDYGVKWPVDAILAEHNVLLVLCGKLNDYKIYKFEITVNSETSSRASTNLEKEQAQVDVSE